jgi:hypothetical protein
MKSSITQIKMEDRVSGIKDKVEELDQRKNTKKI